MQGLGLAADDQKDAHGVYPAQHDEVAGAQHWQEGGEEVEGATSSEAVFRVREV